MTRLIICRHGNTFDRGDIVTRVGARTDLPLSSSGRAQAARLSQHFVDTGFTFERSYTSSLRRTQETANAILSAEPHLANQSEVLPFLTELDYGPDENQPEHDVVARIGQAALQAWDERAVLPDGWQLDVEDTIQSWMSFLTALAGQDGDTLVVTSNGIARFLPAALKRQGCPSTTVVETLKLRTGAYAQLDGSSSTWILQKWNTTAGI